MPRVGIGTTLLAASLSLVFTVACGSGGGGDSTGGSTGQEHVVPDCGAEAFTAGIQKPGDKGLVEVAIESSDPAPPAQGNDVWVLDVADSNGAPLSDATLTVVPFMPQHGHGSSVKSKVTALGDGRYQATPVNFIMPGKWQITVNVTTSAGQSDSAVFTFCIAD